MKQHTASTIKSHSGHKASAKETQPVFRWLPRPAASAHSCLLILAPASTQVLSCTTNGLAPTPVTRTPQFNRLSRRGWSACALQTAAPPCNSSRPPCSNNKQRKPQKVMCRLPAKLCVWVVATHMHSLTPLAALAARWLHRNGNVTCWCGATTAHAARRVCVCTTVHHNTPPSLPPAD